MPTRCVKVQAVSVLRETDRTSVATPARKRTGGGQAICGRQRATTQEGKPLFVVTGRFALPEANAG